MMAPGPYSACSEDMSQSTDDHKLLYDINTKYVVQPALLSCAEYMFSMDFDFTLKRKDKTRASIFQAQLDRISTILTALMNTSGGICTLICAPTQPKDVDLWQSGLQAQLPGIPNNIFDDSIELIFPPEKVTEVNIYVKKSPEFTTVKSCLYVRGANAITTMCHDIRVVREIMMQQSHEVPSQAPTKPVKYLTTMDPESRHIEYKFWNVTDSVQVIERLNESSKSLLAFGNNPGGGDLVIGVQENKSKLFVAHGVTMADTQKEKLRDDIGQWMKESRGMQRIWGMESVVPTHGKHWALSFVPVVDDQDNNEKCLIVIHMAHCPGGLFERSPEAFVINDEGNVMRLTFSSWKTKMMSATGTVAASAAVSIDTEEQVDVIAGVAQLTMDSESSLQPQGQQETEHPNDEKLNELFSNISWSCSPWTKYLKQQAPQKNQLPSLKRAPVMQAVSPVNLIPSKEKMVHLCEANYSKDVSGYFSFMEDHLTAENTKNCIISFLSWSTSFDHSACLQANPDHLFDSLHLSDNCDLMTLWSIMNNTSDANDLYRHQIFCKVLGRVLKKHLLSQWQGLKSNKVPNLFIEPKLYNIHTNQTCSILDMNDPVVNKIYTNSQNHRTWEQGMLENCLSSLLYTKNTWIKDRIGHDRQFILSEEQIQAILDSLDHRFNIIEGAPGSGKSIIANYLCERFGSDSNKSVLFMCPAEGFANLIRYQSKCAVRRVKDSSDLAAVIDLLHAAEVLYNIFIVDDVQIMLCHRETWMKFLEVVFNIPGSKLFLLKDSKFQCPCSPENSVDINAILKQFCTEKGISHSPIELHVVHRNTKIVFTYLKKNILQSENQLLRDSDLAGDHPDTGDDVSMTEIANLWQESAHNGLLIYICRLIYPANPDDQNPGYNPEDIVVLLDDAEKARFFRQLCKNFWPAPINETVQDAAKVPAKGVTIDTAENFVGLEAYACLHVASDKETALQARAHADQKFRLFIASRGTHRVDFLYPTPFEGKLVRRMGFEDTTDTAGLKSKTSTDAEVPHSSYKIEVSQTFGVQGDEPGQLRFPRGLAVFPNGNIILADSNNNRVQLFSPGGSNLMLYSGGEDPDQTMRWPTDVTITPDGCIVVITSIKLYKIDPSGQLMWVVDRPGGRPRYAAGVTSSADGTIFVSHPVNHCVHILNSTGSVIGQFGSKGTGPGELKRPCGLAVTRDGHLIVVDRDNHRLQVFSLKGEYKETICRWGPGPGELQHPRYVYVNKSDGRILVSEGVNNRVQMLDHRGHFISYFGTQGSAKGQFDTPEGVAFTPTGDIVVADFGNDRVQIFTVTDTQ